MNVIDRDMPKRNLSIESEMDYNELLVNLT